MNYSNNLMDLYYFLKSSFKGTFTTVIIGLAAFSIVLVTTLNFSTSILTFLLFVAIAIFQKSFSRGWLFLLGILLIFPSMKISGTVFSVHDIFLVILGVIGLGMMLVDNLKIPIVSMSYNFFLLELVGASIIVFSYLFGQQTKPTLLVMLILLALYWVNMTSFQYFFQTLKRMKRFFIMLIAIAVLHSLFGLLMYFLGFQTLTGLGISSGKLQFLFFNNIDKQVNGLLGDGYSLRVGANALAPFLLISIPLTISMILNTKKAKRIQRPLKKIEKTIKKFKLSKTKSKIISKAVLLKEKTIKRLNKEMFREIIKGRAFLVMIISIQLVGLFFTFSYAALLVLFVGLFIYGLLLRNRKMISFAAVMIIALTLILPGSDMTIENYELSNAKWISDWKLIQNDLLMGNGWKIENKNLLGMETIRNSYLLIWSNFGLFGFVIFLSILWAYFRELYISYKTSDGEKRIWLIGIIAIFFEFVFLGFTNNSFFFGPAALVFWLLLGSGINLRRREIVFGITETHYKQKKLI